MTQVVPTTKAKSKKGRGLVTTGILLIVVAVLAGLAGAALVFAAKGGFIDLLTQTPAKTPINVNKQFDRGVYFIYQDTRDASPISVSDIGVVGRDGALNVYVPVAQETITINGVRFVDVAGFKVTRSGTYQVNIVSNGNSVIIGASLGTAFQRGLPGFVLGALASLLFLIGVIVLIIGAVQVSRRNKAARAGAAPLAAPVVADTSATQVGLGQAVPVNDVGANAQQPATTGAVPVAPADPAATPTPVTPPAGTSPAIESTAVGLGAASVVGAAAAADQRATEPTVVQPEMAAATPAAAESAAAEPVLAEPAVVAPAAPVPVQPESVVQQPVAAPAPVQPAPVQPAPAQPVADQPVVQQPVEQPLPLTPAPATPAPAPVAPVAPAVPAGWYHDPQRQGGYRYWDGTRWTEHRA